MYIVHIAIVRTQYQESVRRTILNTQSVQNRFAYRSRLNEVKKKIILHIHTTYMRLKSIHKFTI